jgi:site-specific recombinase XerD
MSSLSKLNNKFIQLVKHNADGSFATKSDRIRQLKLFGKELKELGFVLVKPQSLKPKHIESLINHWKEKDISAATIKNRMSNIRWWAEKIGKQSIVRKNNSDYGIENRQYVTSVSKGKILEKDKFLAIPCNHIRSSLLLQREFGLRREEAIKFSYSYAVHDDHLKLKGTWCKGGKERVIPITRDSQREVLKFVLKNSSNGNLIPARFNYVQQLRRYERYTSLVGLNKMHGLRHEFAQTMYKELSGWDCPAKGGPARKQLDSFEKAIDQQVRLKISQMLGHERIAIVAVYLGG